MQFDDQIVHPDNKVSVCRWLSLYVIFNHGMIFRRTVLRTSSPLRLSSQPGVQGWACRSPALPPINSNQRPPAPRRSAVRGRPPGRVCS